MKKITIQSRLHSYPVYIGHGTVLKKLSSALKTLNLGPHFVVITSAPLLKLYGPFLQSHFPKYSTVDLLLISDKEKDKSFPEIQKIISRLIALKIHRKTCLVAFGGGVIGDITGFVASIYMRGLNFISIPTTLLSQVDSSLGGKCGVNTLEGKNLVGSFYPPKAIFSEISFLKTLPLKHYQSGLAEVIKYAIIDNQNLWKLLHAFQQKILDQDSKTLEKIITECIITKKKFIEGDEHDFSNRQILNFGHTIGHALEACSTYQKFTHGQAIAQGMHAATEFSLQKNLCSFQTAQKIHSLLKKYGFQKKALPSNISSYVAYDKKRANNSLSWILMEDLWNPQRISIPQEVS